MKVFSQSDVTSNFKMDHKTTFQEIISEIIKPAFKKINFKTSGTTFLKDETSFVKVFNIQSSQFNSSNDLSFTFNIGFFFPYSYRLLTTFPYPKNIKETDCQIRIRSGYLTNDGKDNWYRINNQIELDNFKIQVYKDIKTIIEFFEKYNSITDLIHLKNTNHIMTSRVELDIAVVLLEQGKIEEGNKLFNTYYQNYKGNENWIKKLEQFADQRGIRLESKV